MPAAEPRFEALADELLKTVVIEATAPKTVHAKPGNGNGNGNGNGSADIDKFLKSALADLDLGSEKVKVPKTAPLPPPPVEEEPLPTASRAAVPDLKPMSPAPSHSEPPLTPPPTADMKNTLTWSTFGSTTTLLVDGSPAARTYLKFPVTGIGTKTIVSAKLQLYAVDPSDTGGRLHRVSSSSWTESTLRWVTAPAYDAAVVGTFGAVVANAWYELDVDERVTGDGTLSFALESTSTNGADYRSRESGATWAPRLVIVVR